MTEGKLSLQDAYKKVMEWTSSKPPIKRLATQDQLSKMEIRFCDCVIVYKLKHIETQASKYKRRKVAKYLGYSFRPLRNVFDGNHEAVFETCVFNPSDCTILKDHILNLESLRIRFINCRFLRRDNKPNEKIQRYWRNYHGNIVKFSLNPAVLWKMPEQGPAGDHNTTKYFPPEYFYWNFKKYLCCFDVKHQVIRLKDLPSTIEFMIEETENEDLRLYQ